MRIKCSVYENYCILWCIWCLVFFHIFTLFILKCIHFIYFNLWENGIDLNAITSSLCKAAMKSLKFYEHLLWRNGSAILSWPKPVVLRSNLWFPDDNRCLLSDSRCSEHSGISYLHLHSYSLKFFYSASLIVFEGSGFLDSCWNSNSLLEGTLLLVLRWSPDFHAVRLIWAHMPNSYNIFPFSIKQILSCPRDFLPIAALTFSHHQGIPWPLLTLGQDFLHTSVHSIPIGIP